MGGTNKKILCKFDIVRALVNELNSKKFARTMLSFANTEIP